MSDQAKCEHAVVVRSGILEAAGRKEAWHCESCGADFYHMENLSSGPLQLMEPYATLRDQFAMAALTGMLADPNVMAIPITGTSAYKMADVMMEARK